MIRTGVIGVGQPGLRVVARSARAAVDAGGRCHAIDGGPHLAVLAGVDGVLDLRHVVDDRLDVSDVDDTRRAAPCIEVGNDDVLAARVGDLDAAVAVEHLELTGACALRRFRGVQDLAVELDVAALHRRAVDHIAVVGGVVGGADVAVVVDQAVQAAGVARLALRGVVVGRCEGLAHLQPVLDGVVGDGHAAVVVEGGARRHVRGVVGIAQAVSVDGRLADPQRGRRSGQHRPSLRQRQLVVDDAALDEAVDVEVARANEHAAVGHDALGDHFAGRWREPLGLVDGSRIATDVEEVVGVALDEVAIVGHYIHRAGADVAGLGGHDRAGLAVYLHQAARVGDRAGQLDVGCRAGPVEGRVVRVVAAGDHHLGPRGVGHPGDHVGEGRRGVAAVQAVDVGEVVDLGAVESEARGVGVDRDVLDDQVVGRVVGERDLGITRCPDLAGPGEGVALHQDAAQIDMDVGHRDEVGRRPVDRHARQVSIRDRVGDGQACREAGDLSVERGLLARQHGDFCTGRLPAALRRC